MIGHVALSVKADDHRQAEMGFTFARAQQGRGLAREAAEAVLDYAFGALGLHRVVAVADCENARSVALLERLGMRREGHFVENIWFKGAWGSEYLYALLQKERLARRGVDFWAEQNMMPPSRPCPSSTPSTDPSASST